MTILNDTRKADLLTRAADYGNREGRGLNAKPDFALDVTRQAADGAIGTADAAAIWGAFREASTRTQGHEKKRISSDSADGVRTSELKRFIMVGARADFDGAALAVKAVGIINAVETKGSTYENLVKVMRAQIDKTEGELTDDEIREALAPKAKDTDEQQELEKLVKAMTKLKEGTDPTDKSPGKPAYPSEELDRAIQCINERLAQLIRNAEIQAMHVLAAKHGANVVPLVQTPEEAVQSIAAE